MKLFMKKFQRSVVCILILFAAAAFAVPAFSQETTGAVEGVVKDATGAVIPRASIVLTGEKLIGNKVILTDNSGYYRFVNIDPGTYTITVTAPGFSVLKRDNVAIEVGRPRPLTSRSLSVLSRPSSMSPRKRPRSM